MLAEISGIKIYMYAHDHNPPHFHVIVAEYSAAISIETLEILAGYIPAKKLTKIVDWAEENKSKLTEEWTKMQPK